MLNKETNLEEEMSQDKTNGNYSDKTSELKKTSTKVSLKDNKNNNSKEN